MCLRIAPVRWWRWSFFAPNPIIVARAILHEPAVSAEGVGMGAASVLLDMIAAGKVSRALRLFLGALGDLDPEAPGTTEAEAKHALRNGRCFMANEYGTNMTYAPDWERARVSKGSVGRVFGRAFGRYTPRGWHADSGCRISRLPPCDDSRVRITVCAIAPLRRQTPFAMSWSFSTLDDLRGEGLLAFRHC